MATHIAEKYIEQEVLAWLNAVGIFAYKVETRGYFNQKRGHFQKNNNIYAIKGIPDICAITSDGRALYVECKSAKGQLSQDQELFLARAKEHNAIAIVARSLDEVIEELAKHGYTFNFKLT